MLSRNDFLSLRDGSHFLYQNSLLIYYKANKIRETRIGVSISKKICNAYKRNYYKRIIRETFRKSSFKNSGYDILFVVNKKKYKYLFKSNNFESVLKQDLERAFTQITF